ncbi:MAG: hypothetical protein RLZZ53_993 [Acidobacteriota bacterium]|jgi:hypothetical protein
MSYLFPKRVLRTGDILTPVELSEDFLRPVERISGKVNAHNVDTSFLTGATIDDKAFYQLKFEYMSLPFFWTGAAPGAWGFPDASMDALPDAYLVNNNFEWQTIIDSTDTPLVSTVTTGTSVLWINAYAQYLWHGFYWGAIPGKSGSDRSINRQHYNNAQKFPAAVQFALRVDGNIIQETITGINDFTYRSSLPVKPVLGQRSGAVTLNAPGPRDVPGKFIGALAPPCIPVRVGACVPVQPGEHTVELVVRRVPYIQHNAAAASGSSSGDATVTYGKYDRIFVYDRQLSVIDLKLFDVDSSPPVEVVTTAIDDEELLSSTTLYTDRLAPAVTAYNAVAEGALERGALPHNHISDVVLNCATTERGPFADTEHKFNNWFPGHYDDTITTDGYNGSPKTGWKLLTNAGNVDPISVTGFTVTEPCTILVFGNTQLRNVFSNDVYYEYDANGDPATAQLISSFALFKLMWQFDGDGDLNWQGVEESLGMVNNFTWWPYYLDDSSDEYVFMYQNSPAELAGLENAEIQLMAKIQFNPQGQTYPVDLNFGIFGSVANDGDNYNFISGNIVVIALRGSY